MVKGAQLFKPWLRRWRGLNKSSRFLTTLTWRIFWMRVTYEKYLLILERRMKMTWSLDLNGKRLTLKAWINLVLSMRSVLNRFRELLVLLIR